MLQLNNANTIVENAGASMGAASQFSLDSLLRVLRRQWPLILASSVIMFGLAIFYVLAAIPSYSADLLVMIDTQKSQVLAKQDSAERAVLIDPGLVESQVEILKSDSVARAVVRNLDLVHNEDFNQRSQLSRILSAVTSLFDGGSAAETPEDLENSAVDALVGRLKVKRVGVTYVIDVTYTGRKNAELAAQIANAVADAYTVGELDAKYEATKRATKWLQDRIKELQEQSTAADHAVQKFKADNNIVDTSRGLMNESQLSDVNTQLVNARAATAEAKARLDRIQDVSRNDVVEGSVAESLKSEVITRLRAQYLDLSAKEADLSNRYGKNHLAVVNLRNQMNEIRNSIRQEILRIAAGSKSDYEIALAREQSVQQSLETLVKQSSQSNQAQVKLRDLESSAAAYRNLYDNFLQKMQEATQQQTFPVSDARVITPAVVPDRPSWPKKIIVLPGSLIFGALLGFALAVRRELLGSNFRSADDIRTYAGLPCLGVLPELARKKGWPWQKQIISQAEQDAFSMHVITSPFSRFTETMRNVKVSLDIARGRKAASVVGITSAVPREGKTTFAANLAAITAQMGHRTLLIDADLHNPSLTSRFGGDAQLGLMEVLLKKASLSQAVIRDAQTGLDLLPAVVPERRPNSVSLMTSQEMIKLIEEARETYEYVYLDLPPVVSVVDVKAVSHLMDNFVFVIEWGHTTRDVVLEALTGSEQLQEQIVGAVLNKVPPNTLKRYESYKGAHHHNYYSEEATIRPLHARVSR